LPIVGERNDWIAIALVMQFKIDYMYTKQKCTLGFIEGHTANFLLHSDVQIWSSLMRLLARWWVWQNMIF